MYQPQLCIFVPIHALTPFLHTLSKINNYHRTKLPVVVMRVSLIVTLTVAAGIYFGGSNQVARFRYELYGDAMLWDATLLHSDTLLWGWILPQGQLALWLDANEWMGPTTLVGNVYAEILQIMYASYYLWGNAMAVYLLLQYVVSCWTRTGRFQTILSRIETSVVGDTTSPNLTPEQHWRRLMMFSTAWTGTYILNFTINLMVPAVSPRIYLAQEYQHDIEGLYFCHRIRSALKGAAANSFSAFPSGHCGLSWLSAVLAHRFGFRRYAKVVRGAAVLITLATIVLRYHYFVDALSATLLLAFGMAAGNLYRQSAFDACVTGTQGAQGTSTSRAELETVSLLVA